VRIWIANADHPKHDGFYYHWEVRRFGRHAIHAAGGAETLVHAKRIARAAALALAWRRS
jgi:hypothetical protein